MHTIKISSAILSTIFLSACGGEGNGETKGESPELSFEIKHNASINTTTSYQYQKSTYRLDRRYGLFNDEQGFHHGVAYADFDKDGDIDLVLSGSDGINNNKPKFYFNVDGNFYRDNSVFSGGLGLIHPRKTIVGDYDGNGYIDVINFGHGFDFGDYPGEAPEIYLNNEDGFTFSNELSPYIGFNHCGASADIDGDGDIDVLVGDANNAGAYFLLNDGSANFTPDKTRIIDNDKFYRRAFTCELYDVNNDGYIDILFGGHEFEGGQTQILLGNSFGVFDESILIPAVDYMKVVLDFDFADLDNDGFTDIVILRTGSIGPNGSIPELFYDGYYIQLLMGGSNGFEVVNNIENRSNIIIAKDSPIGAMKPFILNSLDKNTGVTNGYQGEWLDWIRVQDVNGDGFLDIVDDQQFTGIQWLNNGSGYFTSDFLLGSIPPELYDVIVVKDL